MNNNTIDIFEVEKVDEELATAFNTLLLQLSDNAAPLTENDLQNIISSKSTILIAARQVNRIIGTLTLLLFTIPTGLKARIEDVVVDIDHRGKGIGANLIRHAIDKAQQMGAKSIDLTSSPKRQTANQLYKKLGFKQRNTNVYRLSLKQ